MSEKQWPDWSDLMKGDVGEPAHPLSKPVKAGPVLAKGEVPRKPTDEEVRKAIMAGAPKQPTDQQMFGHLVVSEEQVKAAETKWNDTFNSFYKAVKEPIDNNAGFTPRGAIDADLSDAEKAARNMATDEDDYGY